VADTPGKGAAYAERDQLALISAGGEPKSPSITRNLVR